MKANKPLQHSSQKNHYSPQPKPAIPGPRRVPNKGKTSETALVVLSQDMKNYLKAFGILTDEEIDLALQVGQTRTIRQRDFFIREGQVCKEVAFVQSGFFRSFYHNAAGDEITYCFSFSGAFITAYSSFITQEKTVENIYAMTNAEIFSMPRNEIIKLEQSSINWLRLIKILGEQEFLKMEQRVFLLKESAENRYKDLLHNHPEYLQQIPLNHLASFLGITQRHLSRIRKSVRN